MIDKRELRIGNLYELDNSVLRVTEESFRSFNGSEMPIPLTEQWMKNFGFENKGAFINKISLMGSPSGDMDGSTLFQYGEYGQSIYKQEGIYYFELSVCTDDYGDSINTNQIEFVHQLQNLHFALTGKELEIK